MKKWAGSFHPYALCTILCWSLAYVLTRLAMVHFSAVGLGVLRYVVAAVVLGAVCFVGRIGLPRPRDLPWFIAAGVMGFFLYMIAFNMGTGMVSAATSSVIIASVPVFTALLARLLLKERLARRQWVATGIEFAGILVLTLAGAVFTANMGALWLLVAALLLSGYNLVQRRLTSTYPALQATAYSIFAGTLLLLVFSPAAVRELRSAPPVQLLYVLLLGVFSSAVAYLSWSKAFSKAEKTSQVSNYMFFTPLVTGVLGYLLAGEAPDVSTWIGGAFILAGAVLFGTGGRGRET